MAERSPAWKRINEDFAPVFPDKDIICKDCAFRLGPMGGMERYTNGYCKVYTPEISSGKPHDVLWEHGTCKYYLKDEEDSQ